LESQAETTAQGEYDRNVETETELGLPEGTAYTDIEDVVQTQLNSQAQNLASAEQSAGAADTGEAVSLAEYTQQARASAAAVSAANATTREGAGSTTAGLIASDYRSRTENNIRAYEAQIQAGRTARATALANLQQAQREGNQSLIEQYQQDYDNAYLEVQQAETDYMNAYSTYSETQIREQAATQSALESFQTTVNAGTEMSVETIQGFANQLGVDFDTAYGYYTGAQSIRDDKTLDTATKQAALDQFNYDFGLQLQGIATDEAKKVYNYLQLVKSGNYSEDELAQFAISMDIPDENNPIYQAELKLSQAEATIADKQAQGIPVSASDWVDYYEAKAAEQEIYGNTGGVYIPTDSEYEVTTVTNSDGSVSLQVNATVGADGGQCGAFVNDLFGGDRPFTDLYTDKLALVDYGISMPQAGMALVLPATGSYAVNGHVGFIESVDTLNQIITYIDSNSTGDETIARHTISFSQVADMITNKTGGYVVNTNSQKLGVETGGDTLTMQAQALVYGLGGTADERAEAAKNMVGLVNSGEAESLAEAKKILGYVTDSDKTLQESMSTEVKPIRENYNEISLKLASLPDLLSSGTGIADVATIVNFLKVVDPRSVARETEVANVENATSLINSLEQYYNKLNTGQKLTDEQRAEMQDTIDILSNASADTYLMELFSRQAELDKKGLEMNFVSQSEIDRLTRQLGEERVNAIKQELGLIEEETYVDPVFGDVDTTTDVEGLDTYNW